MTTHVIPFQPSRRTIYLLLLLALLSATSASAQQGTAFNAFVDEVLSTDPNNRAALVDAFLDQNPVFPLTEQDTIAYFIYVGSATSAQLAGDMNGWSPNQAPLTRLSGTNLWYRETIFEPDARLDYKLVLGGSQWILDPRNPNQAPGGFGANSELAMPAYTQPSEIVRQPNTPRGTVHSHTVPSAALNQNRSVRVYTPPGYADDPAATYPLILFHDGGEYLTLASAQNTLDNLIDEQQIEPVIGVFVPPVDRNNEYGGSKRNAYETFIVDELMPFIDAQYRTRTDPAARAMTGVSFGGLITTQICYNRPDVFGLAAPVSPSYWQPPVLDTVLNGPRKPLRFYIDWGTYEGSIMTTGRVMRDHLEAEGYDVMWNEWHEGHSWGSWRAHLDNILRYFFPATGATFAEESADLPKAFALHANYPNPFNPTTTLAFDLPRSGDVSLEVFDMLGRRVAVAAQGWHEAGRHVAQFDADGLASGLYLYRLRAGAFEQTRTMLLLQ